MISVLLGVYELSSARAPVRRYTLCLGIACVVGVLLVAGCDSGSNGDASLPRAPSLSAPINAASNVENAVYLEWKPSPGAETYRLQVSSSADFKTLIVDNQTVIYPMVAVNELQIGVTHYWRVSAINDTGVSPWSSAWAFTPSSQARLPSAVDMKYPLDGTQVASTTVTFQWEAAGDARFYHVQAALEADFYTKEADVVTGNTSQDVTELIEGYFYFWRVRGESAAGFGPWSPTRVVEIRGSV